jgi:hypothetical protein
MTAALLRLTYYISQSDNIAEDSPSHGQFSECRAPALTSVGSVQAEEARDLNYW